MNKHFYLHIAIDNLKKNAKKVIPFFLTSVLMIMMFYMVTSLYENPNISTITGGPDMQNMLSFGSKIIAIFVFIFICYTYSFLMKQRSKEFALFNILGMEKKHVARVILYESMILLIGSLCLGFILGIILDKAFYLLITRILDAKIELGFYISISAIVQSILLFICIYSLIYLKTIFQIHVANPIELLRSDIMGEKEPKSKWILALCGVICLACGYTISIQIKNPVTALSFFFIAVVLVIIGTYLTFTAGSIILLKLLRKNKSYYYKTNHFISVSSMMYRMKQNAVGLANICIMSTMILVMLSSTISLWAGINNIVDLRFPRDISISMTAVEPEHAIADIHEIMHEKEIQPKNEIVFNNLQLSALRNKDRFHLNVSDGTMNDLENAYILIIIPVQDINASLGTNYTLNSDEVYIYSNRVPYDEKKIHLANQSWNVKGKLDTMIETGSQVANVASSLYVIVDSYDTLSNINNLQSDDQQYNIVTEIMFDVDKHEKRTQEKLTYEICFPFSQNGTYPNGYIHGFTKESNYYSFISLYGGLLFIGIFLSVLFVMATVLIMYYKQITEGYQDQKRFDIMQKIGLDQKDVKKVINSQVLTVFFLPLIVAGIHIVFAFPIIEKLLRLLSLSDSDFYLKVTIICFIIFSLVYAIIYLLTSKTYYRIVQQKN